jgi:TRAP-type C4-dicarboxylate transport system substrate-binding protein
MKNNGTHPGRGDDDLRSFLSGRLKIDIYSSDVLGSEVPCIEQLQSGELAMTKTSRAAME